MEKLLEIPPGMSDEWRFCDCVAQFVYLLHEIREAAAKKDVATLEALLLDLVDWCDGIPAEADVLMFFRMLYHDSSSKAKVKIVECVGRLRGGLDHVESLAAPLLKDENTSYRLRVSDAVLRAIDTQRRFARRVKETMESCSKEADRTESAISHLEGTLARQDLLVRDGQIVTEKPPDSQYERLLNDHTNDYEWFCRNREVLLREHPNEFVAIRNGVIVACAPNEDEVYRLVERSLGPTVRVFVERVEPDSFIETRETTIFLG